VKCGIGAHLTEVKNSILCYRVLTVVQSAVSCSLKTAQYIRFITTR